VTKSFPTIVSDHGKIASDDIFRQWPFLRVNLFRQWPKTSRAIVSTIAKNSFREIFSDNGQIFSDNRFR
jgi:hypothetical protein